MFAPIIVGLVYPTVLAFDLGGTSLRAALVRQHQVLELRQMATPQPALPQAVLTAAWSLAQPLRPQATHLAVACAGAVVEGCVTPTASATYPGWEQVPVQSWFSQRAALPCVVLNDARAAAWGEAVAGVGQGCTEFMFVTISTGIGAGLVLGGRLHLAQNGLDAELGFTHVPAQQHLGFAVPHLGHLTAFELEASGTALGRQAKQLGFKNTAELCDAAEKGDWQAQKIYQRSAALLAWRIADMAALLGLQQVALGGSVGLRAGYLQYVKQTSLAFPNRFQPRIVHAQLRANAGLIGAAAWMIR